MTSGRLLKVIADSHTNRRPFLWLLWSVPSWQSLNVLCKTNETAPNLHSSLVGQLFAARVVSVPDPNQPQRGSLPVSLTLPAHDTRWDPCWGWFGSGAETRPSAIALYPHTCNRKRLLVHQINGLCRTHTDTQSLTEDFHSQASNAQYLERCTIFSKFTEPA